MPSLPKRLAEGVDDPQRSFSTLGADNRLGMLAKPDHEAPVAISFGSPQLAVEPDCDRVRVESLVGDNHDRGWNTLGWDVVAQIAAELEARRVGVPRTQSLARESR